MLTLEHNTLIRFTLEIAAGYGDCNCLIVIALQALAIITSWIMVCKVGVHNICAVTILLGAVRESSLGEPLQSLCALSELEKYFLKYFPLLSEQPAY